jgi:hypothetical protein
VIVAFDAILDAVVRGSHRVLETAADDPVTQDALATAAGASREARLDDPGA